MKTLTLPLQRKWFDMIKSGEKKEEYRDQSEYWIKRLLTCSKKYLDALWDNASIYPNSTEIFNRDLKTAGESSTLTASYLHSATRRLTTPNAAWNSRTRKSASA